MTKRIIASLAACVLVTTVATTRSDAAAPRLPANLYPAGAHLTYQPTLTNAQMDCAWGFFCEAPIPLFHFASQEALHRTGGWAQSAKWQTGRRSITFQLFASRYEGTQERNWSAAAEADLVAAIHAHGYMPLRHASHLFRTMPAGHTVAEIQRSGDVDLVVMACWAGTSEVEAIAMYHHGSTTDRSVALTSLAQQVRTAIRRA